MPLGQHVCLLLRHGSRRHTHADRWVPLPSMILSALVTLGLRGFLTGHTREGNTPSYLLTHYTSSLAGVWSWAPLSSHNVLVVEPYTRQQDAYTCWPRGTHMLPRLYLALAPAFKSWLWYQRLSWDPHTGKGRHTHADLGARTYLMVLTSKFYRTTIDHPYVIVSSIGKWNNMLIGWASSRWGCLRNRWAVKQENIGWNKELDIT